jgi:EpsD family peptidyl-prolyl cis-trans isomerase
MELAMQHTITVVMRTGRTAAVLAFCGVLMVACSKKSGEEAAAPNSQVVAHVGNEVVTTQELDNEFRLSNIPADKQKDQQLVKRVLGELVTRKYLFQQALNTKLDREPSVLLDILRSKEQVLANAFVSRAAANKASSIGKADIEKYVANNPSKFANRQLIAVEQISFPIGTNLQAIIDSTKDAKSLDEVEQKLTSMGVPHGRSMGNLNSAELPDDLFKKMQAKNADDVFFIRAGQNGVFLKVKGEESRPLEGEVAANFARQLMRSDLLKAEIGMASVAANLEAKYEGVYSKIMQDENSAGKN